MSIRQEGKLRGNQNHVARLSGFGSPSAVFLLLKEVNLLDFVVLFFGWCLLAPSDSDSHLFHYYQCAGTAATESSTKELPQIN